MLVGISSVLRSSIESFSMFEMPVKSGYCYYAVCATIAIHCLPRTKKKACCTNLIDANIGWDIAAQVISFNYVFAVLIRR